jgi:hypothetical protein
VQVGLWEHDVVAAESESRLEEIKVLEIIASSG